ncbi:MAG: OmpA family protein [Gammaproteobacteria bacterium]
MFKKILITTGLALAITGVAFMPGAHAQGSMSQSSMSSDSMSAMTTPPDNRPYITLMGSYPVSMGHSGFGGWGGLIGFGKPISDHFGFEVNYQQYYLRNYGVRVRAQLLGIDGLLFFHRGTWNPYAELGVGLMRAGYNEGYGSDTQAFGTAGVGVIWRVASYFDLRADLRFNGTFSGVKQTGTELGNPVASVGIVIPFGTPPQAAQQAAPAPAEEDTDGDGVPNNLDQCPGTPAGVKVDSHGCPLDSDHDGVPNYLDQCPNTPPGVQVDVHGCPINATIKLPNTHFAFNSSKLTAEDQQSLDDAAGTLNKYPNIKAIVAGYTDSIGTKQYNIGLSNRRANSVKTYLVGHGVNSDRLTTHGYGESDPVAPNRINGHDNPAGRAKNRRVELHVMNSGSNNTQSPEMGTSSGQ